MNYTFAVGIDGNNPDEVSIFYVWNNGVKDCYSVLDTCFLDVYSKYGFSFEEKFKKEIRNFLITDLTNRYKKGLIPMENIESIGKHQVEKNLKERN